MLWKWQPGETFQFFVQKQPGDKPGTTDADYYIFDRATGKWRHSATINSPNGGKPGVGTIGGTLASFLENFLGTNKDEPKLALYRLWLGPSVDTMKCLTRAGGDGKWGEMHDTYFLAEGDAAKLNAVFTKVEADYGKPVFGEKGKELPPISNRAVPAAVLAALQHLPQAPKAAATP